jgi:hypothetical protein
MTARRRIESSLLAGLLLAASCCAHAQFALSDLQIAGRALGFLEKPLRGDVVAAVVFAPANAESVHEAENLKDMLGDGLKVGGITIKAVLVPVNEVGSARATLFLLTTGVGADGALVAAAAQQRRIPCVTTDLEQVRRGTCAVGVRTKPKIEILVNRKSAAQSEVGFSPAFRMMITEM